MFFYKIKGRVHLDGTGDFILTRNDSIVRADAKQAAPLTASSISGVTEVSGRGFIHKIRATWAAIRFIWGSGVRGHDGAAVEYTPDGRV